MRHGRRQEYFAAGDVTRGPSSPRQVLLELEQNMGLGIWPRVNERSRTEVGLARTCWRLEWLLSEGMQIQLSTVIRAFFTLSRGKNKREGNMAGQIRGRTERKSRHPLASVL